MEALGQDVLHIIGLEVRKIGLLDAGDLIVGEPIRGLLLAEFVQDLGVELRVVDGGLIVDEDSLHDAQAQVATTAGGVAERMRIVGGGQERGIAGTVLLAAAEDGTSVDLDLREGLLELGLLRGTHVGKLIDVDQQLLVNAISLSNLLPKLM